MVFDGSIGQKLERIHSRDSSFYLFGLRNQRTLVEGQERHSGRDCAELDFRSGPRSTYVPPSAGARHHMNKIWY
jgi:hypothetical protein